MFINDQIEEITFAYEPVQVITDEQALDIIRENHNDISGHLGIQKTYSKKSKTNSKSHTSWKGYKIL